jgi:hypothetical protein
MPIIEVNGQSLEFPDNLSPDDMNKAVASAAKQVGESSNSFDKIKKAADFVGGTIGGPIGGFLAGKAVDKAKEVVNDPRKVALGVVDNLPAVGAVAGSLAGSGLASIPLGALGAAGGQAFKQLGRRALGENPTPGVSIPFSDKKIPDIPGIPKEASDIVAEGAMEGAIQSLGLGLTKGWSQLAQKMEGLQKTAAGSAFGGIKTVLNKIRGGSEAFKDSAVAMQDKGVFGPFTSPEVMRDNVEVVRKVAGEKIGSTLQAIDDAGVLKVKASNVAKAVYNDLKQGFDAGYSKRLNKEAAKVAETIMGYGDEIKLKQLQDIKKVIDPGKWGDVQMAAMGEDGGKIFKIRQRAVAKLGKIIEDGVNVAEQGFQTQASSTKLLGNGNQTNLNKGIFEDYKNAKKVFADAENIKLGLEDKIKRLEGKQFLGLGELGSSIGALSEAISGDPRGAAKWLLTAAGIKYLRSFGPQQGAMLFKVLKNSSIPEAALTAIVQKVRSKDSN